MAKRFLVLFFYLVFIGLVSVAQKNVLTFGIQFKPIIPSDFFRASTENVIKDNLVFDLKQRNGYVFGMVIRKGFTKSFSLETGINFAKRNYTISLADLDRGFNEASEYGIIAYEIPIKGLVYIRLSEKVYMNTSFGFALDIFPSSVGTLSAIDSNRTYFNHISDRNSWAKIALVANVGYEFRTEKQGYFYVGASYHRPFGTVYRTKLKYIQDNVTIEEFVTDIDASYITIDFRYFFHEDPERKSRKKKK